jgi:predicted nucleic acid-binding protein
MQKEEEKEIKLSIFEVIIEAIRGIRSEILLYAIAMAALLVGSAKLGSEILKEIKWPLMAIFSVALIADFIARAIPRAKARLRERAERR